MPTPFSIDGAGSADREAVMLTGRELLFCAEAERQLL